MNKRQFNKILKSITDKKTKMIDAEKAYNLTTEEKDFMVKHIVRNRGPILVEFIDENTDMTWLYSCAYLYKTTGKSGYTFLHTSEQKIK